jgi:hypothetical protein
MHLPRYSESCSCSGRDLVVPFPVVALYKSSEGWGCGIPPFAKCAKDGAPSFVVVLAYSRFLTGLSARFGMTKFYAGLRRY